MKRIPQIDGLRAIASLLVVSFHYINYQLTNSHTTIGKIFAKLFSFGWAGVDLFFVLSGFLIGSILISNKGKVNYFSTFYIRRFVRIIPNYYLLVVLFILLSSIPFFKNDSFITGNSIIPYWGYFTMLQNVFMAMYKNMGNAAMSVTWSIAIEEQFYLIIPFLIYILNKKYLSYLLILCIVAANFFRWHYTNPAVVFNIPAYVLLPCRMDAISVGVFIASINSNKSLQIFAKQYIRQIYAIMACIAVVCVVMFTLYQDIGVIRNSLFAIFFGCLIILGIGLPNSLYGKLLSINWLTWIGKISYSLYLFHFLILGIFKNIAFEYVSYTSSIVLFITTILALSFSFLFSWLVYKYLETPAVLLGKRFNYK